MNNLEILVFDERGNRRARRKASGTRIREPTNSTHNMTHVAESGIEPRPHWWEASALMNPAPLDMRLNDI